MARKIRDTAGEEHNDTEYFAYVRVSTDKQDTINNRHIIEKWLNGGDHKVNWYEDAGYSGSIALRERPGLHQCIKDAKAVKGTIIVATLDRFGRKAWETLQFFDQVVSKGKVKFVCCDDPTISEDKMRLHMKAMFAEFEREKIQERTKKALDRINEEIAEKGSYITKEGKTITQLGGNKNMAKARAASTEKVQSKADYFADMMRPVILDLLRRGFTFRDMADYLEAKTVMYPTQRGGKWGASTVYNLVNRIRKFGPETASEIDKLVNSNQPLKRERK